MHFGEIRFGRVKISLFSVVVLAAVLYSDFSVFTVQVIVAAALHELGHLIAMKIFGVNVYSVSILPYGAVIQSDVTLLPYKKEAITALSGIFINIAVGMVSLLVWIFTLDIYTLFFLMCNFFLAFVNLVPIPTLDGARALEAILSEICTEDKKICIMDFVYYFSFLSLVLSSLWVLNVTNGNFSLVIFLCCIFIGVYAKRECEE